MLRAPFLLAALLLFIVLAAVGHLSADGPPVYRLVDAYPGIDFHRPVFAVQPPDGTPRMFVVEQDGRVYVVDHPAPAPPASASKRLFLDLGTKVSRAGNEEGLLGFAFHPRYASNGRFFASYTARYTREQDRRNVVTEMRVDPADPDRGDPATEREVLSVPQPFSNHDGGWIGFGPDGMLYVARGDGGSSGDPQGNGQNLGTLLGKILRIDVDGDLPYETPTDNPFRQRAGARAEIWAYGLRNPWRCSFDRATGDLWAGDVGQGRHEEVDRVVRGANYGWDRKEGFADYEPSATPPADALVDPITAYSHDEGESITGGYVYRGAKMPSLASAYLYGDFGFGTIWTLRAKPGASWPPQTAADAEAAVLLRSDLLISSFAEDRAGEVYVVAFDGRIFALESDETPGPPPPPPPDDGLPPRLSSLRLFADLPRHVPVDGALGYAVRAPLWSDGADKDRFLVLPQGASLAWNGEDAFALPVGSYAVKTFERDGRRLETRVIARTSQGFEAGAYAWLEDLSDAVLAETRTEVAGWTVPSRSDCRECHTTFSGFLLGVTSRQVQPVRGRSDLVARWVRQGVLTGDVPPARERPRNVPLRGRGRLEARVRSYLDANCASCHRPGAPLEGGLIDLRASVPLEETGLLDAVPDRGDLGIADARIVAPGEPERSVLLHRLRDRGDAAMPPVGSERVHGAAVRAVERWIRSLR